MQRRRTGAGCSGTPQEPIMRLLILLLRWRLHAWLLLLLLRWLHAILLLPALGRRPACCGVSGSGGGSCLRRRMGFVHGAGQRGYAAGLAF